MEGVERYSTFPVSLPTFLYDLNVYVYECILNLYWLLSCIDLVPAIYQ